MAHVHKGDCLGFIRESRVMTLGTMGSKAQTPWTAPVYYLYEDKGFYFFSNPKSRHIQEGSDRPCSASIFKDAASFEQLMGVQMTGQIKVSAKTSQSLQIAVKYARRFSITISSENVLNFFKQRFHARLYSFDPREIYFMDNGKGFGSREKIQL